MTAISSAPAPAEEDGAALAARNRLVIGLLLVSAFVVILNETIIGVALPHLMRDLAVTASAAQWLSTAFMLTMAVVIPVTGFLLQRFHTRPIFMAAMLLFSLGTLICALAPGLAVLIIGRIVQASGTAIMMPLLMTTVMTLVPPSERGKTMGSISIVISVAPAIGPTISGFILSVLDWRWMFWLVLPISLASLALGIWKVTNVSTPRKAHFDPLSVVLAALGFGTLVYGLSAIGEAAAPHEGNAIPAWMPIAAGAAVVALFVWRQLRLQTAEKALLDLRTFKTGTFTVAVIIMAICMMALFGTVILLPMYMQNVLGRTPLTTGMLLLPGGLTMGLMAPFVGRAYDRIGAKPLVIPGTVLLVVTAFLMSNLGPDAPLWYLLVTNVLFCFGLGLLFTPLFSASLGSLPPALYSHGSAVLGTTQQVAGAAGTALFVAIMSYRAANLKAAGASEVAALSGGIHLAFLYCTAIAVLGVIAAMLLREDRAAGASGHPAPAH